MITSHSLGSSVLQRRAQHSAAARGAAAAPLLRPRRRRCAPLPPPALRRRVQAAASSDGAGGGIGDAYDNLFKSSVFQSDVAVREFDAITTELRQLSMLASKFADFDVAGKRMYLEKMEEASGRYQVGGAPAFAAAAGRCGRGWAHA